MTTRIFREPKTTKTVPEEPEYSDDDSNDEVGANKTQRGKRSSNILSEN